MKFDLENLNPGVFFPFDEDDSEDEKGGIEIRLANSKKLDEINKKCSRRKVEFRRGQRHEYVEENEEKKSEMLWDYVIVGWKGVYDINGNVIECTQATKIKLMRESVKFSSFVGKCIEILTDESEDVEVELEKNVLK